MLYSYTPNIISHEDLEDELTYYIYIDFKLSYFYFINFTFFIW